MEKEDYQAIRKAIDALNQGTMRLAELMMDSAVSSALKGKTFRRSGCGGRADRAAPVRAGRDRETVKQILATLVMTSAALGMAKRRLG